MKNFLLFVGSIGSGWLLLGCNGAASPPPPSLMTSQAQLTASPAVAGTPYSFTFQAAGVGTLTWSAAGLPSDNLSLDPATGIVSGTPPSKASVVFTLTVTEASGRSSPPSQFTIAVNNPSPPSITTTQSQLDSASPEVGNSFSFSFTATGGLAPLNWTETGALPSSFALSPNGVLSGTPMATGTFPITVTVQDSAAQKSAPQNFTITVVNPPPPVINTSPTPVVCVVNQPFTFTFTATGGLAPLNWTQSDALPAGLTFSAGGVLSGVPTVIGSFPISVTVQDSLGRTAGPQDFTIQVVQGGFSSTGSMETPRSFHTATMLLDGRVLVAGGQSGSDAATVLGTAELYDPGSGTFSPTGSLTTARTEQTATLLSNGKVLIAGGSDASGISLATAELFNPTTGTFSSTGSMTTPRVKHTATLLNNGMVLVAGGREASTTTLATAELYDPSAQTFIRVSGAMESPRAEHTATLLENGMVLVAGGASPPGDLATAELFDPSSRSFAPTNGDMTVPRLNHTATLLKDGRVLLTGPTSLTAEVFDPSSETFVAAGSQSVTAGGGFATATLRSDGTVLVAGGEYGVVFNRCSPQLQSAAVAELFDPASGNFAWQHVGHEIPAHGHIAAERPDSCDRRNLVERHSPS